MSPRARGPAQPRHAPGFTSVTWLLSGTVRFGIVAGAASRSSHTRMMHVASIGGETRPNQTTTIPQSDTTRPAPDHNQNQPGTTRHNKTQPDHNHTATPQPISITPRSA